MKHLTNDEIVEALARVNFCSVMSCKDCPFSDIKEFDACMTISNLRTEDE